MTDKVQKIRKEVERLKLCTMDEHMNYYSREAQVEYNALAKIEDFIDNMEKESKNEAKIKVEQIMAEVDAKFPKFAKECKDMQEDPCNGCTNKKGCVTCENGNMREVLQEESVSEYLNTESMIGSYKQRLISQTNGVKNSPLIDMCLASYKHGINETLDTLNLSNVERTVKDWKEPISDDLGDYINELSKQFPGVSFAKLSRIAVRVAKWQKEKMMANTADAMIGLPYENKDGGYTHLIDVSRPLPVGNNKIAIIFKEE